MDKTDHVLDFVQDLKLTDIPGQVRHQGKRCLLDTMGALLGGTATPLAQIMTDFALRHFSGNQCTILSNGAKASAVGAGIANGFASNALDAEHGYRPCQGRPGAALLPVALAAVEMADSAIDGKEFLTTLIMGYEVSIRAGMMRNADPAITYTTGSWGNVGAAAAAARLLKLDRAALRESLGAADYHGPIGLIMKGVAKPCMAKDGIGWGAMVAMSSVLMAREGFTAPEPPFDDSPDPAWVLELGRFYRILGLYFKPYACCRWAQAAITGALKVVGENALPIEGIASIRVKTFKSAASLSRLHPTDTEHAQYNLSYPIAAALVDGVLLGTQVSPPRIYDRKILDLADIIEVEVCPEFQAAFPAKTISEVIVRTRDGRELKSGPLEPKWEPPDSPSDEELDEKFRLLAGPVLGEKEAGRLSELIWNIEDLHSAREIIPMYRTSAK